MIKLKIKTFRYHGSFVRTALCVKGGTHPDIVVGVNNVVSTLKKTIEENSRLSAEIDVVRRLQQMILPRAEELGIIKGLDIVGYKYLSKSFAP